MKHRAMTLGKNRGKPRLWFQSKTWMVEAGFVRGAQFNAEIKDNHVVIVLDPKGDRKVTGKEDTPIIDLNTDKLKFDSKKLDVAYEKGRIVVTAEAVKPAAAKKAVKTKTVKKAAKKGAKNGRS